MKTYHSVSQTITTKYYGPTNTKGSRIKATAEAGSIWVSWDYALNVDDNHAAHEESSEAKVKSEEIHWELGIDKGEEGTETIDAFDNLHEALRALRNTDNETAFVDMWVGSNHIGQEIRKRDL